MADPELANLVDEFLYLVEVGSGSAAADESELEHLLDRLALAVRHGPAPDDPIEPPAVPPRDVDTLRKIAASRYRGFGTYNRVSELIGPASRVTVEVAHAVDDVAAIADHLHAVAWLGRNAAWDTALWYLHASHAEHWGRSMRALQMYLHVRRVQRERAEAGR